MLALVLGEAASGKSEFAEQLAMSLAEERYYIATMQVGDAESRRRIERHRQMRQGKGFDTLEQPLALGKLHLQPQKPGAVALLECASTLLGNELYLPGGAGSDSWRAIVAGVQNLLRQGLQVVVVSNCVFAEGATSALSPEMQEYVFQLGLLNRRLAQAAEQVVEVCCGLPLYHKKWGKAVNEICGQYAHSGSDVF